MGEKRARMREELSGSSTGADQDSQQKIQARIEKKYPHAAAEKLQEEFAQENKAGVKASPGI